MAMAHLSHWRELGLVLPLSLNLSCAALADPQVLDRLQHQLRAHPGLLPEALGFDIAAAEAFETIQPLRPVLTRLRQLGVDLALDHFGCGRFSLADLGDLPITRLKIDSALVHGLKDPGSSRTTIGAIAALARNFGLQLLAQGVDDERLIQPLRELGVALAQGFYVARPMPAEQLVAWIRWRPADPLP